MWGSNQSAHALESDQGVNGATQSAIEDLRGLSSLNGVWGRCPVAKGFWKIFDRMELFFFNCSPCQKDCTWLWTSWWCWDCCHERYSCHAWNYCFFHPKILFIYQFHCRHENFPFACMNSVLMKLSMRVVNWHSNIFGTRQLNWRVAATVSENLW